MRYLLSASPAIGLVIVMFAGLLVAQSPAAAPWLQLTFVQVQPAMVDEYIAVEREVTGSLKRTGVPWRIVGRTEVFGDAYEFLIATPAQNLASFDATKPDSELANLKNRAQRYLKGQRSFAVRTIPEIDNPLPSKEQPALIVVNVAKVFPGREQDYLNVMKSDFLPHFNKANVYHMNGTIAFGAGAGFIHLFYVPSFAKLDEGSPVVRALGTVGAQAAAAKLAGIVGDTEQWVVRLMPDLSYGPWSMTATPKP
jgi:hypothetical protein